MSSQPWSAIGEEVTLEDADSVMLLLDGETGVNANKRATLNTLKTFIVDQTASIPIFTGVNDSNTLISGAPLFFPLSGNNPTAGTTTLSDVVQTVPINLTFRNLTVVVSENTSGTDFKVELVVQGGAVLNVDFTAGAGSQIKQSTGSGVATQGDTVWIRITGFSGSQVRINGISCTVDVPISGGLATEFTWAASDEDSPLITGILYTTEVANVSKPLEQVILSLKNTPTSQAIEVNVIQESAPDSNQFNAEDTIFLTNPQIDDGLFSSLNSTIPGEVKPALTWGEGKRLRILLPINDSPNFAATGLKISLL